MPRPRAPRRLVGVLWAAAALAAAPPARVALADAAPPAIAFAAETCDLGSVVQGEQPACDFSFTNGGGGELRVLHVEPGCGCTSALLSAPVLGAGERGAVRVLFDSAEFVGEVVKEVEVRSNDPARPLVTLRLRALVEAEVEFEPRAVTFADARDGAPAPQTVMVTNRRAEPVRVLRVDARPASCTCALAPAGDAALPFVLEPWDRVPLVVRFSPPGPLAMPVAGECTLEIDGARKREFRLKILALPSP